MSYRGDIRLGETHDFKFTTRRFSTGAPHTLAGSPVISAYVGNGTTEITAGITLTVDFDGRTGLNNVRVVATSGNGFATATNVQLVITTGTVDSVSVVGEVVAEFSIENRSAVMPTTAGRTLTIESDGMAHADLKEWLGVAPLALVSQRVSVDVTAVGGNTTVPTNLIVVYATDFATNYNTTLDKWSVNVSHMDGTDLGLQVGANFNLFFDNDGGPTTALLDNLSSLITRVPNALTADGLMKSDALRWAGALTATDDVALATAPANFAALLINASGHISRVTLTDTLTTYTSNTPQTGDSFARLGAPAGASIAADIATRATPAQVNSEVLDVMNVDTLIDGKTFVAATRIIAATTAGKITTAGTGTEVFLGLDGLTTRVTVTCDASGNRSTVVYA